MYLVGGSIIRTGGQFLTVSLITLFLGVEQAGQYVLAMAIAAPIFVFTGLGINSTFFTLKVPLAMSGYERALLFSYSAGALATGVLTAFVAPNLLGIVALVCLLKALDGLSDLYALTLQRHGQYRGVLTLAAERTAVYLIPTALALVLWRNLVLALFITAVASGVFVLARNRSLAHRLERAHPVTGPGEAANGWRRAMTSGLQVGAGDAIASLATAIPQYLLSFYLSAAALVPFTYATYILVAIEMVLNARILIWMKRAQQQRQPVVGEYVRTLAIVFPLGALGILGVILLFKALNLEPLFTDPWAWLAVAGAAVVLPAVYLANAALLRKNLYHWTIVVSVAAAAALFLCGVLIIPQWAVTGALLTVVCGAVVRLFGLLIAGRAWQRET